ncbi:T9SS type A sorting domain-containing protein [Hymenobacter sp. BRD67]|uniref:T9SS type A sorting domain-containing protein n=1 Tax=Hymenobacter sp. BRD67 TaxID=2675877 RepID=UPI0015665DD1|nr:T9SS type A sorting domain-containing protein [Hymenobacter sp. BRD67]QKG53513.1 T9SS type A sorting domain-containing protein [Hymenobacter sp. BRD67]
MAIVYIQEGATGAYPGYTMVKNAAGDFTFTRAIANGTVTSVYFTYQVGAGGPENNTAAAPHSYTVGTSCGAVVTSSVAAAAAGSFSLYPNPTGQQRTVLTFTLPQSAHYDAGLYDLRGAKVATIGTGNAIGNKEVTLAVSTSQLASGVYLVKLITDATVVDKRLIVSH